MPFIAPVSSHSRPTRPGRPDQCALGFANPPIDTAASPATPGNRKARANAGTHPVPRVQTERRPEAGDSDAQGRCEGTASTSAAVRRTPLGLAAPHGPWRGRAGPRRVLVAGGAGFLGAHLCRRLLERGDKVFCLDNMLTGRREAVAGLQGHPRFVFLHHDVIVPFRLAESVDDIFNLACPGAPAQYRRNPLHTYQSSVAGARNLLELARQDGARYLLASGGFAHNGHGAPAFAADAAMAQDAPAGRRAAAGRGAATALKLADGSAADTDASDRAAGHASGWQGDRTATALAGPAVALTDSLSPQGCHDEGKRLAEALASHYARGHGLQTRIARIHGAYGPGMSPGDGRVIPTFIVQALLGMPLTIDGDGQQRRAFVYVDDLTEALIRLMETPDANGQPVDLAGETTCSISQLARLVLRQTGGSGAIVHRPAPEDAGPPPPCIAGTRGLLGWQPQRSLEGGLESTIAHFRAALRRIS